MAAALDQHDPPSEPRQRTGEVDRDDGRARVRLGVHDGHAVQRLVGVTVDDPRGNDAIDGRRG